jgi:hypothetical protein
MSLGVQQGTEAHKGVGRLSGKTAAASQIVYAHVHTQSVVHRAWIIVQPPQWRGGGLRRAPEAISAVCRMRKGVGR